MTRELLLTKGAVAIVDDKDYEWLTRYRWKLHDGRYAARTIRVAGKCTVLYMHRAIVNAKPGDVVDHTDLNKLNNTRTNLRLCTKSQNERNRSGKPKQRLSLYKGVSLRKNGVCVARIFEKGCAIYIGSFSTELEAAKAYDQYAREA